MERSRIKKIAGKWQADRAGCPFPVPKTSTVLMRGRENKPRNGNAQGYTIRVGGC